VSFRPEEISALILKHLKQDAELHLGGPVTDAVITVSAYFDDAARRATRDAGAIAGLTVRRVLNEPTAAALGHGAERDAGTVLVYDLGGGTFDVTVMRIGRGDLETLATSGDRNLGGHDWDDELMALLNRRFQEEGGPNLFDDERTEADLRDKAEAVKHALTTVPRTRVVLAAGGVTRAVELTRGEFEDATASLLGRTRDIAETVLDDAGLRWADVDRLLLAGGSTRMPMVREPVERVSGRPVERAVDPDEVVALGAAVQARLVGGGPGVISVRDVTSQRLGMLTRAHVTVENVVVIPPNARIPATLTNRFRTVDDDQAEIRVQVTEADPDYVKVIGEQGLPIPPHPAGALVDVTFAHDVDQTVFLEATDLTTGRSTGRFRVRDVATANAAWPPPVSGRSRWAGPDGAVHIGLINFHLGTGARRGRRGRARPRGPVASWPCT
jgi:molecular chaperone DnaK